MAYESTIALVVKVLHYDIFEGTGEVGENGQATGFEVNIDCTGVDNAGKFFNVDIFISVATRNEMMRIAEDMPCGTIHFISGIFFMDSDENYDILRVFDPEHQPVVGEKAEFYSRQFDSHHRNGGEYIYRKHCDR
jgi:hypothetical protein